MQGCALGTFLLLFSYFEGAKQKKEVYLKPYIFAAGLW